MVAAAELLLRQRGIAGVTTRAIAEAVPCSEGAIYVHFEDRLELLLAVLRGALPEMVAPLHALELKAGQNLALALKGLLRFHDRVGPMLCSLITEPELLKRFRQSLESTGKGPQRGIASLARYIELEQKLGRINKQVDAKTAASVLMASSFFQAFTHHLLGSSMRLNTKRLVALALRCSDGTTA
jgi:AcrR family transcriptional regulator